MRHFMTMPVIFRHAGFRFFFYSNEGNPREPVHVHVRKDDSEAKFCLNPVSLASSDNLDARALKELAKIVEKNSRVLERAWHEYFG